MDEIVAGILGETTLRMHGNLTAQWGRPRERAILGVLLAQANRTISADTIIEQVWPGHRPPLGNPAGTLRTHATRIRQALTRSDLPITLHCRDGRCRITMDLAGLDRTVFRSLAEAARQRRDATDHAGAIDTAKRALALVGDMPLADVTTDWAHQWRESLIRNDWLPTTALLVDQLIVADRAHDALTQLDSLPPEYATEAALAELRLRALIALGRGTEATSYFLSTRRVFIREGDHAAADRLQRRHDTLNAPDMTLTAPPAEAAGTSDEMPPHQLPHDISDFVGRAELFAELDQAAHPDLAPTTITVSGLPGVGKTSAVVRWAHQSDSRFPGGNLFADLHGFSGGRPASPAEVVDHFLTSLGFPADHIIDPQRRATKLRTILKSRRPLIILDNVADSAQIRPLLPHLNPCVVLITSRQRLSELAVHHGAHTHTLAPLDSHDARRLLSGRIGTRAAANPTAIAKLVNLCAGIPLALSLLGEHAATRPGQDLHALCSDLTDNQDLILDLGRDSADTRGLASVLDSSYRALPADAQAVFAHLGLHPGTQISTDAVAALAGYDLDRTRRALRDLTARHLVLPTPLEGSYHTHDVVYTYARTLVDAVTDSRAAVHRLCSFYLHTAAGARALSFPHLPSPPNTPPLARGVTAGTFTSADQARQWIMRERANLLRATHAAAGIGLHDHGWALPHAFADVLNHYGFYDDYRDALGTAVTEAAHDGDVAAQAASLNDLARLELNLGNTSAAGNYLDRCEHLIGVSDDHAGRAAILHNKARRHWQAGDLDTAHQLFTDALRIADDNHHPYLQAGNLHRLGEVELDRHRRDSAESYLSRALAIRRRSGDRTGEADTLTVLARLDLSRGRYTSAQSLCEDAIDLCSRTHHVIGHLEACVVLTSLALTRGDAIETIAQARRAIELAERAGSPTREAHALDLLAQAATLRAEHDAAYRAWTRAAALLHGRDHDSQAEAMLIQARATSRHLPDAVAPQASERSGSLTLTRKPAHD